MSSTPPKIDAPNFERNGFHTRYSIFCPFSTSTDIRFSPYTDSPGTKFLVTKASSLPRATKMPANRAPRPPPRPPPLPPRWPNPPRPPPPPPRPGLFPKPPRPPPRSPNLPPPRLPL
ncbi:hypothetical protein DERF_002928 [Dermatophagoides farinae]|uniref:Uncharacterized protein n=1 Tax=Dermatophagoides farinae TaxID=6954 RepID=A0A922ICJ5_DERFA|nr:hypothetical protein DERF_002928 [Dermatophagoides farinae]